MRKLLISIVLLAPLVVGVSAQDSSGQDKAGHDIIGAVHKVDRAAGKVVVKTAEGAEEMFKFTGKTTARGLKDAGKGVEEGSRAIVHYAGEGADKTAVGVEDVGKETPRAIEGAVVDTGKGVVKGTEYIAKGTEASGREIGRLAKRVGKAI